MPATRIRRPVRPIAPWRFSLDPLDQTGCSFFEDHAIYTDYTGIVLDDQQTVDIASALGTKRALILANHGSADDRPSVEQALLDMIDMERTCAVNLRAMATGSPLKSFPPKWPDKAARCLTQPMRYPFQWEAVVRQLDRHETDYNPWRTK